jgi:hypothetical protein
LPEFKRKISKNKAIKQNRKRYGFEVKNSIIGEIADFGKSFTALVCGAQTKAVNLLKRFKLRRCQLLAFYWKALVR